VAESSARLVLIVSGLNAFSADFHNFPEQPIGIIEITASDKNFEIRKTLRRVLKFVMPERFKDCRSYCRSHGLLYARVARQNKVDIGAVLKDWRADLAITFSVPILPMRIIEPLPYGALNLHHALLPAYRGGNPLLWQVIDSVRTSGASVHRISAGADEGELIGQSEFSRPYGVSKDQLVAEATAVGLPLMKRCISLWVSGEGKPISQPDQSTTTAANHFSMSTLPSVLREREAPLSVLWDVACFLGHWPPEAMPVKGWRSWFRWRPDRVQKGCAEHLGCTPDQEYSIETAGAAVHLRHCEGCVVLRPKFHITTVLARLLLRSR